MPGAMEIGNMANDTGKVMFVLLGGSCPQGQRNKSLNSAIKGARSPS